jgi:hypothetical protein
VAERTYFAQKYSRSSPVEGICRGGKGRRAHGWLSGGQDGE